MTPFAFLNPALRRTGCRNPVAAWLLFAGLTAAHAQTTPPSTLTPEVPPVFRSVFEHYQPYTGEKRLNWKEANDTTARIGGWREYARQATEPTGAAAAPNTRAPVSAAPAPHASHTGHTKP